MQVDLLSLARNVVRRDVGVDLRLDPYGPRHSASGAGELGDRLAEQLDVELEADSRDVARLLRPEQVAGAADLEVAHGDREAGARAPCGRRALRGARGPPAVSSCPSG